MKPKNLFFIFLGIFLAFILIPSCFAWSSDYQDWNYRRAITINNSGSDNLTDYQVFINVTYDTDMATDFRDIRFTWLNGTTEQVIPYIANISTAPEPDESLHCFDSSYCEFYVKVPFIPASGTATLYMYYGNSGVNSTANASAVYDACFITGNEGWTEVDPDGRLTINTTTHKLEFSGYQGDTGEDYIYKDLGAGAIGNFTLTYYGYYTTIDTRPYFGAGVSNELGYMSADWTNGILPFIGYSDATNRPSLNVKIDGTLYYDRGGYNPSTNTLYKWIVEKYNDTVTLELQYENGTSIITKTVTNQTLPSKTYQYVYGITAYATDLSASSNGYQQYIILRKHTDPEPSYSIGDEEASFFGSLLKSYIISPFNTVYTTYPTYKVYLEENETIANLTLILDGTDYTNTTTVYNASNYSFTTIYTSAGNHNYNFTVCTTSACYTSSTVSFTVSAFDLYIYIRDENTNQLITNETATVSVYTLNNTLVNQTNTTTGIAHVTADGGQDYIIVAYTNESYSNQRRKLFLTGEEGLQNSTIFLLEDGLGSINYIKVADELGTLLEQATVKITWNNEIIDYGVTDTLGLFISYLDPYKLYTIEVSKDGYTSKATQFYGSSLTIHEIQISLSELTTNRTVEIWFSPEGTVRANETEYIRIHIKNWRNVDNVTVILFDELGWKDVYEISHEAHEPHLYVYSFDLNDTDYSWCNSSIDCFGNLEEVQWRVSPLIISDIGTTGHVGMVAYAYLKDGEIEEAGSFSVVEMTHEIQDFLKLFSREQRHFMGLIFVLMLTSISSYYLRVSFRQAGFLAMLYMVLAVVMGFWEKKLLIAPVLAFLSLLIWREVR